MKKKIGRTKNGFEVYVITNNEHMEAHADVTDDIIVEAIRKVVYRPPFWMNALDMGRIIGKDKCVEITDSDDTKWVCRPGRSVESHMVYNKKPIDTTLITVGMCTDDVDGLVTIFTAHYGVKAPKEPTDSHLRECEREESEKFWNTHALCAEQ